MTSVATVPKQGSDPKPASPTAGTSIPFLDLRAQFATIKSELMEALTRVMESQHFILGQEVQKFEEELRSFVGSRFAISCASGSDALLLALLALGIGPGDEVITTPFTFVATAGSIARAGAKPVFVDIDPITFNIDTHQIASRITERTKAVMPVHLFGLAADMDPILEITRNRLAVIEDAAQAIGARYRERSVGTMGHFGCFSFFPSKNLGGAGDGGIVTTDNPDLAERIRLLRVHGTDRKYHYQILGVNSRLDALQAALLRVKLKYLPKWTAGRQQKAARYRVLFHEHGLDPQVQIPAEVDNHFHVYNQFVIRCRERDELRGALNRAGIPTEVYYPEPLHVQPAFAYLGYAAGTFPVAEAVSREVLALPVYPELPDEDQVALVRVIARFYETKKG